MAGSVLITGGTGGLGTAVVQAFLDDGWRVVVPWVVEKELERVPKHPDLELTRADLFEQDSVEACAKLAAGDTSRPLTAVVNLVGGFSMPGRVHETPVAEFESQLRLNLRPTYLVCQATIPYLLANGGGAIVCVGSRAAVRPASGQAGYITAKAGVIAFVTALDAEYKQDGIRVNAVMPSIIDTAANRADQPKADYSKWVKPAEIASVIHYLCSDMSAATSEAAIPVYGKA